MSDSLSVWNKVNLNIDQVSQLTGVKKTTLRYWEKEFSDYLKPERTETKRRQYSMEEVEKVSVLKQLIEDEKYKSAGVRLKLGLDKSSMGTSSHQNANTNSNNLNVAEAPTEAPAETQATTNVVPPRSSFLSPSPLPGVFFPNPLVAKIGGGGLG